MRLRPSTHTHKKKEKPREFFCWVFFSLCVSPTLLLALHFCSSERCSPIVESSVGSLWCCQGGWKGLQVASEPQSASVSLVMLKRRVFIEWVYSYGTVQLDHKNCSWLTLYSIMYIISLVPFLLYSLCLVQRELTIMNLTSFTMRMPSIHFWIIQFNWIRLLINFSSPLAF